MIRVRHLGPADWAPAPQGQEARLALAAATRVAVWAQGLDAQGVRIEAGDGAPVPFQTLGETAFAVLDADGPLRLVAPAAPRRCTVLLRAASRHSPTLAPFWPRAVASPAARPGPDAGAARARMEAALAVHDLDAALAALAEMLVAAREDAATQAAAAALLAHLARHPLSRSPALGAVVAALAG